MNFDIYMISQSVRRSTVACAAAWVLFAILCFGATARADVVFKRPNIEGAQRAMQERYMAWAKTSLANGFDLNGFPEKIVWPALSNGKEPGDFPEDCFYDEELIDPTTREVNYNLMCFLIADLASKIPAYLPASEFIHPDYLDRINGYPGLPYTADPVYPSSQVNPWNYQQFFSIIGGAILQRSNPAIRIYSTDSSGALDVGGMESGGFGYGSTCDEARTRARADFRPFYRTIALLLGRLEITSYTQNTDGTKDYNAVTQTWSGRYGFDHSVLGELGGTAQVAYYQYDYVKAMYGTPSSKPPSAGGAPGPEFGKSYVTERLDLTPGGKYFSSEFGLDNSFIGNCPSVAGEANGSRFGYALDGYVIVSPNFKEQIGEFFSLCKVCSSCGDNTCPAGSPTEVILGSLEYRIPLGADHDGSAGSLVLYSDSADFLMASPLGLSVNLGGDASVLRDAAYAGIPRQIVLPQGLVDIAVTSPFKSYEMKFYDIAARGAKTGAYYQPAAGSEYKKIKVENPGLASRLISGVVQGLGNFRISSPSHGLQVGSYYVMRVDAAAGPLPKGNAIGRLERTKLYYIYAYDSNTLGLLYFDSTGAARLDAIIDAIGGQTLQISSPFPFNNLVITETTGSQTRSFNYTYTPPASGKDNASLVETVGGRILTRTLATNTADAANPSEEYTESDAAGNVRSKTSRLYKVFPWNNPNSSQKKERRTLVAEVQDPSGAALTTTYSYYENSTTDGANYSRLKQVVHPNGSWERFEYDWDGRAIKTYSAFQDAAPGSGESACRVVEQSSATGTLLGDLDGDGVAEAIEQTVEKLKGSEVSRSYRLTYSKVDTLGRQRVSQIRCLETGAAWDAASNLMSDTWTFLLGENTGKTAKTRSASGILTVFGYAWNSATQRRTTVVESGAPSSDGESVVKGTRVTTVSNAAGVALDAKTVDIESGITVNHQYTPTAYVDSSNRATRIYGLDGGYTEFIYQDCCGTKTIIDRAGNTTVEVKDVSGRVLQRTHNGIVERYVEGYDTDASDGVKGRTESVYRTPRGSSIESLTSVTTFDLAGRMIAQLDPRDGVNRLTLFSESLVGGNWRRAIKTADGTVTETVLYRDGSSKELWKAGTLRQRNEFGVESDTHDGRSFAARTAQRILIGDADAATEWSKSFIDPLGREYKTEVPDESGAAAGIFVSSYFDAKGRITKRVDADGIPTLFRYNELDEVAFTAVDRNRNDLIDFGGEDRIQHTTRQILNLPEKGDVVRVTTGVWMQDGSDTETPGFIEDVSTDQRQTWSSVFGQTTHGAVSFLGGGVVEVSVEAPDGTVQTNRRSGDFVVSQKISHPIAGTLSHTRFVPDGLGRVQSSKDELTGAETTFAYYDSDLLRTRTVTGAAVIQTTEFAYDAMKRVLTTTLPDASKQERRYNADGAVRVSYGSGVLPTEYSYDRQGRLKRLTTWQKFDDATGAGVLGGANTDWVYNARGQLKQKLDHLGKGPNYAYTKGGRLKTRESARTGADGVTTIKTKYVYGTAGENDGSVETGDLVGIYYSNDPAATAPTIQKFDRIGRVSSVTDASGKRQITFDELLLDSETYVDDGNPATTDALLGIKLDRGFDSLKRYTGVVVTTPAGASSYEVGYQYDGPSRLRTVSFKGHSVTETYNPAGTTRISSSFANSAGAYLAVAQNFDALNRLTSRISTATAINSAGYEFDLLNRRVRATRQDGAYWSYGYDKHGQVTLGAKKSSAGAILPGFEFSYVFDDIGNRDTATQNGRVTDYTANLLNQYSQVANPRVISVRGSAAIDATVTVNGRAPAARNGSLFFDEIDLTGTTGPAEWKDVEVRGVLVGGGTGGSNRIAVEKRQAYVPESPANFTYDADGNLLSDDRWTYVWDAENRLIRMETRTALIQPAGPLPATERKRLEFSYDSQGRRFEKLVSTWNPATGAFAVTSARRFIYDGWNLVLELDAATGNAVLARYAWGNDLSGRLSGVGGVGGLLWISRGTATYTPTYDGNGNILSLIDAATGSTAAEFEYDPFGNTLRATGPAAAAQPFGFSSKYVDTETGLMYYGFRYYAATVGRWIGRDPIEEQGGTNLYSFCKNRGPGTIDFLGLIEDPMRADTALKTVGLVEEVDVDVLAARKLIEEVAKKAALDAARKKLLEEGAKATLLAAAAYAEAQKLAEKTKTKCDECKFVWLGYDAGGNPQHSEYVGRLSAELRGVYGNVEVTTPEGVTQRYDGGGPSPIPAIVYEAKTRQSWIADPDVPEVRLEERSEQFAAELAVAIRCKLRYRIYIQNPTAFRGYREKFPQFSPFMIFHQ